MLVNLDNDNLPGPSFVALLMQESKSQLKYPMVLWCHGAQGGTCGRVAYWAKTFFELNGCDEDLDAVGYQDVDL
eukprot:6289536-Lingulodinium_polyedra.AAC.1